MWIKLILIILDLASTVLRWAERERAKAEGRAEAHAEAKQVHDERVALAEAARRDADAVVDPDGVRDPFDRDHH